MTPAETLGAAFRAELKRCLTAAEFEEVLRRNVATDERKPFNPKLFTCASHDFMDANVAMDSAWETVHGRGFTDEPAADFEANCLAWGAGWEAAGLRTPLAVPSDAMPCPIDADPTAEGWPGDGPSCGGVKQ